ncbi:signal peptide peptidase SppA [Candidatus Woesearchaeota archaeon]|nr:signal peptide peptidase SppA [Candidatus Woesearchaeota archaeon]
MNLNKIKNAIIIVLFLFLVTFSISWFLEKDQDVIGEKIIVLPLEGTITSGGSTDLFGGSSLSSLTFAEKIREINAASNVKGVIIEINSGGGSVIGSEEIADAIKELNKTKYAVIREVGASGAYWVASATDKIYASPMSITGSVGVIGSYLEFSGLFDKYGVGYERLVGGEYKDIGSPFKKLSLEEEKIMQKKIDIIHEYFIEEVAKNRELDVDVVRSLADGQFYLGIEAKDLGLIDEFGDTNKAKKDMEEIIGEYKLERIEEKKSILDFFKLTSYYLGKGIGSELVNNIELKNKMDIIV